MRLHRTISPDLPLLVVALEEEAAHLHVSELPVLVTGAGKVNAAVSVATILGQYSPSHLVNLGTAGGAAANEVIIVDRATTGGTADNFAKTTISFAAGVVATGTVIDFDATVNTAAFTLLGTSMANSQVNAPTGSEAGWAKLTLGGGSTTYLPVVGFAATSMKNTRTDGSGGNYGMTLAHRW